MNQVIGKPWRCCWVFLLIVFNTATDASGCAQESQGNALQFDSYEGTFISASKSILKIRTDEGDKVFQLAKPSDDLPPLGVGRGTAISISGDDRVSFLKSSMIIRFVAELDKTGPASKPLDSIEVLSIADKMDTLRERVSELDPKTGLASYRFTARIQSIDHQTKRLSVLVRPSNKFERFEFALDPENTRVSYDLPDLSLAQSGEAILVRCLPIPGDNQVASEVRVTRPSPFADAATQGANGPVDPSPNPNQLMANEGLADPADPDTAAGDEEGMQGDADEGQRAHDTQESDEAEPSGDVVEFDFDAPVPNAPTIDHGLLSRLLGIEIPKPQAAEIDAPDGRNRFEGRSMRRGNAARRGWYKIN